MENDVKSESTGMSESQAKTVVGLAIIGYATVCYCTGWLALNAAYKVGTLVEKKLLKMKRDKQWKAFSESLKNAEVKNANVSEYEKVD